MSQNEVSGDRSPPEVVAPEDVEPGLRQLSTDADEWLDDHAEQFDPLVWGTLDERNVRRKAFSEAALYLHSTEAFDQPAAGRLKRLLLDRVDDPEYYHLVGRNPDEVHKFGYPLAYASTIDELPETPETVLERTLNRRQVWSSEFPPFRTLDLLHLARMFDHDVPYLENEFEDLLEQGCLVHPLNPAEVEHKTAYALTHNFLFYHNFGNGTERFADEPVAYDYPESLHGLILRFVAANNCDLVSELLVSAALQRQLPPGLARFALGRLLEEIHDDGSVPNPGDTLPISAVESPGQLRELEMGEWDDDSVYWAKHYHPTFVGAITGRILADAWPEVDVPENRRDLDYESEAANLYKLGKVFDLFSDYDLQEGAALLRDVAGTPTAEAYPSVVEFAAEFLEAQRRPDGEFGYWTDEKRVYLSMDESHDEERFREELLRPASETCEAALEAVRGE